MEIASFLVVAAVGNDHFIPPIGPKEPRYPAAYARVVGVAAVLGQLFLTKAFAAGRPARISVIGLSQVAFAASYKWVFEGRIPSGMGVGGMMLVIGATVWVMLRSQAND